MSEQNRLVRDLLVTQRDQAQAAVREFVIAHMGTKGEPDEDLLGLVGQFGEASRGKDNGTALWGILAGYGILTAIIEYLDEKERP